MAKGLFVNINIKKDRYIIVYDGTIKYDKPYGESTYVTKFNYEVREGKTDKKYMLFRCN